MSDNLPREENWLLIAEIRHIAKNLLGLLILERLLISSFVFPGHDGGDIILLLAVWAGIEFDDFPLLQAVVVPMLLDKLEVVVEIVFQIEFGIGSRRIHLATISYSATTPPTGDAM
jgi:hypothetical protein